MEEVGRLRSRSLGRAFFVSWMLVIPPLCLVTGLIWAGILGAMAAGAITKAWVSAKTDAIIAAACQKHGVDPKELDPGRYLIE